MVKIASFVLCIFQNIRKTYKAEQKPHSLSTVTNSFQVLGI